MSGLRVGHARVSMVGQDLTAQRDGLAALGVDAERVHVDHGLPAPPGTGPVCARRWPPAAPATPWW